MRITLTSGDITQIPVDAICNAANSQLADEHITKAAGPYAQDHYMGDVARVHLQLMRARNTKK